MNNLVITTDFKGIWVLPNANAELMITKYTAVITNSQDEFLKELLGYSFFKELQTAVDIEDPAVIEQKWLNFINGCEYTENSILKEFKGLNQLLVKAMWFEITSQGLISIDNNGISVISTENTEQVDPTFYMMNRWANVYADIKDLYHFIDLNTDVYPQLIKSTELGIKTFI